MICGSPAWSGGVDLKVKMKAGNANSCSQCNQNSRMNRDNVIMQHLNLGEYKPRPQALPSFSSLAVRQSVGGSGIFSNVSHIRMIERFDWMWAQNSKGTK